MLSYIIITIANLDIITSTDSLYHHPNPSSIFGLCRSGKRKKKKKNRILTLTWRGLPRLLLLAVLYRLLCSRNGSESLSLYPSNNVGRWWQYKRCCCCALAVERGWNWLSWVSPFRHFPLVQSCRNTDNRIKLVAVVLLPSTPPSKRPPPPPLPLSAHRIFLPFKRHRRLCI